jgi:hypothetical protein
VAALLSLSLSLSRSLVRYLSLSLSLSLAISLSLSFARSLSRSHFVPRFFSHPRFTSLSFSLSLVFSLRALAHPLTRITSILALLGHNSASRPISSLFSLSDLTSLARTHTVTSSILPCCWEGARVRARLLSARHAAARTLWSEPLSARRAADTVALCVCRDRGWRMCRNIRLGWVRIWMVVLLQRIR